MDELKRTEPLETTRKGAGFFTYTWVISKFILQHTNTDNHARYQCRELHIHIAHPFSANLLRSILT